ncbi:DUF397 domain-containing protein [Streptomyces sp. NPDC006332]|uniref:DUF397 domain-containing protein n=1 Tax=Streptomyces sp. NPDC006332 TaxID=3155456 RepID=UPI0033B64092
MMALAQGDENDGARWFKSSYSGGSGSDCVEVAFSGRATWVRDSKAPRRGELNLPADAFSAFITSLKMQIGIREG